jgi:hypothetical protein
MIAAAGRQKWRREESGISRVLFPGSKLPEGGYLSGTPVTWRLKRFFARGCPRQLGTGKRPTLVPSTLHPTGVYRASTSRCCWCALTAPLHPYQSWDFRLGILDFGFQNPKSPIQNRLWRYISVALSSRSRALGVTQQVWSFGCPDFPQRASANWSSATASLTLLRF